ncbi:hypothetical protein CPC08DRAFT_643432, partial [Agrocybe pediades]
RTLVYIRILGYLLHFIPSRTGLDNLARQIKECSSDNDLLQLGQMYYDQYLRPFSRGRTSVSSRSSPMSRPSFDTLEEMTTAYLTGEATPGPESFATVKKKVCKQALARDGFRCVISGSYDATSLRANQQLRNKRLAENPVPERVPTQCAHIFPASINQDIPPRSDENMQASMLFKIHRLENVMTLDPALHFFFDMLELWFVATGEPNQYTIRSIYGTEIKYEGQVVTLESMVPGLPLPSPAYLAIHAACAQVAHLSGAAEHIDKYDRDMEDVMVLSPTGESADLLDYALRGLQIAGH